MGEEGSSSPLSTIFKVVRGIICCLPCCPYSFFNRSKHNRKLAEDLGTKPNRWPTDVICIFLFVGLWIGLVLIAGFAIYSGNPLTLIEPTDFQDNMCGKAKGQGNNNIEDLSDKPYLWYPFKFDTDITQSQFIDALDMGICVTSCPTRGIATEISSLASFFANPTSSLSADFIVCSYSFDQEGKSALERIYAVYNESGCFVNLFPTTLYGKRCIPSLVNLNENYTIPGETKIKAFITSFLVIGDLLKTGFGELQNAWFPLIVSSVLVIFCCVLFMCCVQCFLPILVAVIIIGLWIILILLTAYTGYIAWRRYTDAEIEDASGAVVQIDETQRRYSYFFMGLAGFFMICLLIYSCLVVTLLKRIAIAVNIISFAATPVWKVQFGTLIFVPPITFMLLLAIFMYWLLIAGYIQSASLPVTLNLSTAGIANVTYLNVAQEYINGSASYTIKKGSTAIQAMQWVHLFGFLWSSAFISALGFTTVAGVIAQWYFSGRKKKKSEFLAIPRSFLRCIIFHSGTLLFGSLILAIVQLVRFIYRRIKNRIDKIAGQNPVVKYLKMIIEGLLWIVEKIVKYFNKNAYIVTMIDGSSFLSAALKAFRLILNNILIVGATNFIAEILLILAKILFTILGGVFTYGLIEILERYENPLMADVKYSFVPTVAGAMIAFIIGGLFTNIYSISIDTILLCFCEDLTENDAATYFMPKSFKRFIRVRAARIDPAYKKTVKELQETEDKKKKPWWKIF